MVLAPRLSSGDERERHRGLSHHSATVLELALGPAARARSGRGERTRRAISSRRRPRGHDLVEVELGGLIDDYAASGLPQTTMGRSFEDDRDFFVAALAAGVLAGRVGAA